nr:TetR/AcrR family transcriptional regulator [Sedimentibacter sp.]
MPKSYSEEERKYIIKRLKEEAASCLNIYGVKKTTVDELVRRVNIPKGTFYLFYDSKELLLYDVINDLHDEIQTQFLKDVESIQGNFNCELLTNLLFHIFKKVDRTCLLKIMMNGDLELLIRKLPNKIVEEHLLHDNRLMEQLILSIPQAQDKDIESFSGAMRGIFLAMMHKREIGEKIFDSSLKLLISGLVMKLMEE